MAKPGGLTDSGTGGRDRDRHCAFRPTFRTSGRHTSCSRRMNASVSAGDIARTKAPRSWNFCLSSGRARTMLRSSLTLRTIAAGVSAGALNTTQPIATKPGIVSATVGKSGKFESRSAEATASGLIELP
jgi:hypothetical protein